MANVKPSSNQRGNAPTRAEVDRLLAQAGEEIDELCDAISALAERVQSRRVSADIRLLIDHVRSLSDAVGVYAYDAISRQPGKLRRDEFESDLRDIVRSRAHRESVSPRVRAAA